GGRCSRGCDLYNFRFGDWLLRLLLRECVATIGDGEKSADRHEQRTAPNPIHERLVINADGPAAVIELIAERYIEIAKDAAIDCGLRRDVLRGGERALLGMHDRERR